MINKSITSVAQRGSISAQAILSEIIKKERAFERLPKNKFVLATSLSARYFEAMKKTAILGSQLTFSNGLPKRFDQEPVMDKARSMVYGDLPTDYLSVRVSVKARSEHEAFDSALDVLDLLRGIWNLAFVQQKLFWFSTGRKQPVNQILLGPIHTLHNPNGQPAIKDYFWYEPDYVGPIKSLDLQKHWKGVRKYESRVREMLSKHSYRVEIENFVWSEPLS